MNNFLDYDNSIKKLTEVILSSKKFLKLKYLFLLSTLISISACANKDQIPEKLTELSRSEIFPPENGMSFPLEGKIVDGRYYAPKNVFSCQAYDFGEGAYTSQDILMECAACVGFYDVTANFKRAEVLFTPWLGKGNLNEEALKDIFDKFAIGILKTVDKAQGIEILQEEMIEDNMLFVAISIDKMSVLKTPGGRHLCSTRGYLMFQDSDKLIVLSNQEVTLLGQKHIPKKHIENLKKDILEFRKTFEFGFIPIK